VQGAPGLDLPRLDVGAVAAGYGVSATKASGRDEVRDALAKALSSSRPELVEVPVEPGMSLF
jgi:benzoylformate decarboxylase